MDSLFKNFKNAEFSSLSMCELGNQDIAVDGINETVAKDLLVFIEDSGFYIEGL